jgi:hypothetical protein
VLATKFVSVRIIGTRSAHTACDEQRSTRFAGIDGNVLVWACVRPGETKLTVLTQTSWFTVVSVVSAGRLRNSGGALVLRRDARLPGRFQARHCSSRHLRFAGAVLPLFPSWEHATRAHAGDREEPSCCVLGAEPECQSLVTALVQCPHAKVLNAERVRFEIAHNTFKLIVAFNFRAQIAFIKFIGSHADYNKVDALTVSQF